MDKKICLNHGIQKSGGKMLWCLAMRKNEDENVFIKKPPKTTCFSCMFYTHLSSMERSLGKAVGCLKQQIQIIQIVESLTNELKIKQYGKKTQQN